MAALAERGGKVKTRAVADVAAKAIANNNASKLSKTLDVTMDLPDKQEDDKLEPISLYGTSLEDALKRALAAKVDPNEPRKAGRKKKQAEE